MADQIYWLTEVDRNTLRMMLEEFKKTRRTPSNRMGDQYIEHQEFLAPETYIARTPIGGIIALDENTTGTGLGTGTGSGSGIGGLEDDELGYAECDIFKVEIDDDIPYLRPVEGLTKVVYNFSTCDIAGNVWILATRDKFGFWFAVDACHGDSTTTTTTSTTTSSTTSTSNTTTTYPPCSGQGLWEWSSSTFLWTLLSDTCSEGCIPIHPTFCGLVNGDRTSTDCVDGEGFGTGSFEYIGDVPCCGQETSTTTTIPPSCTEGCYWKYVAALGRYLRLSNECSSNCPCSAPTGTPVDCQEYFTPCEVPPPPPPPPPCTGFCSFVWVSLDDTGTGFIAGVSRWMLVSNSCAVTVLGCGCSPPSEDGTDCQTAITPCYRPIDPDDPCYTTTTACPTCCTADCYWRGDGGIGWILLGTNCGTPCSCIAPSFASSSTSDTRTTSCQTTTTSTTTTTTLPPYQCWPCEVIAETCAGTPTGTFISYCSRYTPHGLIFSSGNPYCLDCEASTSSWGDDFTCANGCPSPTTTTTTTAAPDCSSCEVQQSDDIDFSINSGSWGGDCLTGPTSGTVVYTGSCVWAATINNYTVTLVKMGLTTWQLNIDGPTASASYSGTTDSGDCCDAEILTLDSTTCSGGLAPASFLITPVDC